MERAIRHSKTKLLGLKTAIDNCSDPEAKAKLQEDYNKTAVQLTEQNKAYNQFCKDNDLKRYDDRVRAAKWSREEAAKAAVTAGKVSRFKDKVMEAGQTSTGVQIRDVETHIYTRSVQRGLNAGHVTEALTKPLGLGKIRSDRSQQFIGEHATVAINVDTGKVITCWPTSSKKVEKLKGGK